MMLNSLDFPKLVQFTSEFQFSTHCRIRHGLGTLHRSVLRIKASQFTCIKRMLSHLISCSYKNGSFWIYSYITTWFCIVLDLVKLVCLLEKKNLGRRCYCERCGSLDSSFYRLQSSYLWGRSMYLVCVVILTDTPTPLKRPLFISLGILFFWGVFFGLVWCAVGFWCRIFTKNERLIFPNNILNLDTWIIHLNTSFVSLGMFKIFIMEIIAFLCCSLCICILKIILKLGIYISLRLVALYTFTFLFHSIFQF